ncbi:MAG: hypothetical protein IPP90_15765 [Gemmatimonadaceae bacterium]|nr:hypothetical protein [Gemmatimonadaceae bacterium]
MSRLFDVYGYEFRIESDSPEPARNLASDFEYFAVTRPPRGRPVNIRIRNEDPDYDRLPPLCATVYTPRNASYRDVDVTCADYHGRGLGVHHRPTGDFEIITRSVDLQYEACYLFLLAQIGEALDRRHLHRVHALCISLDNRAALVLLPMGGGKSTLGSNLLADPDVKLLSDDSPYIDRRGQLHGFPTRIGLLPGSEEIVPAEYRRTIQRMEFGPKVLIDYRYFADRVSGAADPAFVFLGSRSLSRTCEIVPASHLDGLRAMVANCVIGMGLFQGLEFFLQKSTAQIAGQAAIAWSRLRASQRLLSRSRVMHLHLGRDQQENTRCLLEYMRSH